MKALILTDGKMGHENQSLALAQALGCDFVRQPLAFKSKGCKALSYLCDHLGLHTLSFFQQAQALKAFVPPFDVVIGTGSGTFYATKVLARRLGAKSAVVLYPRGYRLNDFDCILAPHFDHPQKAHHVIEIPCNLVREQPTFYTEQTNAFKAHYLKQTGRPYNEQAQAVALIIGGPNSCATMTPSWMEEQLTTIFKTHPGCEFWVTTSRRTPPDVERLVERFPFTYRLIFSHDHFNPIPGFVMLAHTLFVTAESTGMLSEASVFGQATVHVMDNLKPGTNKFRTFAHACAQRGAQKIQLAPFYQRAQILLQKKKEAL